MFVWMRVGISYFSIAACVTPRSANDCLIATHAILIGDRLITSTTGTEYTFGA
jgi:predicted nucleic acid-binding protein